MRLELGRSDTRTESLAVTFVKVFVLGWLVYLFILMLAEHYFPEMTMDFMLHDNFGDGTNDWFRDFVEVNHWAAKGTSYLTGWCANYPPLVLAIAKVFAFFTPNVASDYVSYYDIGRTPAARAVYFIFAALMVGSFVYFIYRYLKRHQTEAKADSSLPLLTVSLLTMSYSMIFLFERGNYIYLSLITFVLFLFLYETHPTASAVALALCACVKVYPVLFFVLFLLDRKYKPLLVGIGVGLAGLFLPMLVLEGSLGEQFIGFLNGVLKFNTNSQALGGVSMPFYQIEQHSNSFANIFRAIAFCFTVGGRYHEEMAFAVRALEILSKFFTVLLVAASGVAVWLCKPLWKKCTVILSLLLLLPNNTFDYMLTLFLPLIAVALCMGTHSDRKYVALLTFLACVPKAYFFIHYGLDVSIQTVLNPLLMTVLIVLFVMDGLEERKRTPNPHPLTEEA